MAARRGSSYFSKVPFFITEILGLGLSSYLFMISAHLIGAELPCARSKWIACESAVKGPFSHIGPFSVAAMGCVYYIIHLALTFGLRDRAAQIGKALFVAGGLVFVAWLRAIEIVWLHKLCPWCWGVAGVTLIHAGFSYYLVTPPLPRLRPFKIAVLIFVGFLALVAVVTGFEYIAKTGRLLLEQGNSKSEKVEKPRDTETDTVTATATPKPMKKTPATSPTPAATNAPSNTQPTPVPTAPPAVSTATPTPKPQLPPEPELVDVPEVKILRSRGWHHAGSGEDVIKIIKAVKGPVLLLAYDPYCSHCHELITTILDSAEFAGLPVTKVAIQESMISGQIDKMIKEVPTLLLFGGDGSMLWSHIWGKGEGPAANGKQLLTMIKEALAKPAQQ